MIKYPPANYIRRIEIDALFGEQNVRIEKNAASDPRILVVYGKNGTGKTTILRIVRSLISGEDSAGHRTRLAKLPFARASVHLEGGTTIEAKRKDGIQGAFDWSVKRANSADALHMHLRPRRGRIASEDWDANQNAKYVQIIQELESLLPEVMFLDDKRTFYRQDESEWQPVVRTLSDGRIISVTEDGDEAETDPVLVGLKSVTNSIRREALMLSNRGNQDAQSIYTEMVKGVSSYPSTRSQSSDELKARLVELEKKSRELSSYGLVAVSEHSELLTAIQQSDDVAIQLVSALIVPYVQSLSARLSAIETLHKNIDSWEVT